MIGRAAFGRPWIFREIEHFLATGERARAARAGRDRGRGARAPRGPVRALRRGAGRCASRASTWAGTRAACRAAKASARAWCASRRSRSSAPRSTTISGGSPHEPDATSCPTPSSARWSATSRTWTASSRPSIYDMVLKNVEQPMIETGARPRRGQPDARRRDARHRPQHAAQEDAAAAHQRVSQAQAGADQRLRQVGHRRVRARARRAGREHPLHRRHGEAAREGRRRRSPRSRRTPAFRRCSTAA